MIEKKIKTSYDVICPFCGTLCDDLEVDINNESQEIIEVRNACQIGTAKFFASNPSGHRYKKPMIKVDGKLKETDLENAINKTAEILANTIRPLLYGFSSTDCEAQGKGVELAEILGGVLDNTASVCHGPSLLAER